LSRLEEGAVTPPGKLHDSPPQTGNPASVEPESIVGLDEVSSPARRVIGSLVAQAVRDYLNIFVEVLTKPASVHESLWSMERARVRTSPASTLFPSVSMVIGLGVYYSLPSDPGFRPSVLPAAIVTLVMWVFGGSFVHIGYRILRGKGALRETVAVSAQVFSATYVVSNVVALMWTSLVEHNHGGRPLAAAASYRLNSVGSILGAPLGAPFLSYFAAQAVLLAICLPRALAPVHKVSLARSVVACFLLPTVPLIVLLSGLVFQEIRVPPMARPRQGDAGLSEDAGQGEDAYNIRIGRDADTGLPEDARQDEDTPDAKSDDDAAVCEFRCSDGMCIRASQVCNGHPECAHGEDEDVRVCADAVACCTASRSCADETGSSCGRTCCCCPGGAACCSDPKKGCCDSSDRSHPLGRSLGEQGRQRDIHVEDILRQLRRDAVQIENLSEP
jgi:hypothetical protein